MINFDEVDDIATPVDFFLLTESSHFVSVSA